MVKLHIKRGDESLFLFETTVEIDNVQLIAELLPIYNGRLKIQRLCGEMEQLAEHGIALTPNMQGLTDEQIEELKLKDEWSERCQPSGDHILCKDKIGRRNGMAPNEKMAEVLKKTIKEAKDTISKNQVAADVCLTEAQIKEALAILRGAIMIVYPMGLPPHDPVQMEIDNKEELAGTQASLEVLDLDTASLWWAGKELLREKKLKDFVGKNEKTKLICKIQKKGQGAPGREPVINEQQQRDWMAHMYRRQEEMKKLEEENDDSFLDSKWADNNALKKKFQGLQNIHWK